MVEQEAYALDVESETNRLKSLVEDIIKHAKNIGATACEVDAISQTGLSVTVRMGEVETVEFNQDQGFGITIYAGKCKGSVNTTNTSLDVVKKTIAAAWDIARYTQEDECAGLADPQDMATSFPDLDLYHPWNLDMQQAASLAEKCEKTAQNESSLIVNSDGATVYSHTGCSVYGNSHGFIGEHQGSRHSVSCVVVAKQKDEMQKDYWYSVARHCDQLESMEAIGKKAAQKTINRLGGHKIKTGSFPVIFQSEVAPSLIGHFLSAISGGQIFRDASFLKGKLGEKIFPEWVTISENPYLKQGLSSCSYDDDGLQTRQQEFIAQGQLLNYILGVYSARKLGMKSTANAGGVRNAFVSSNAQGLEELLQTMDTGFLVDSFIGSSVNIVTGDYSRGATGFWVEKGKIVHPVTEVTIAGRLQDIFKGIVKIGDDVDYRSSVKTGSILIDKMMVAGS